MIERGAPWEREATAPSELVRGDDAGLAAAVAAGARVVRFLPDRQTDLALALGLRHRSGSPLALTLDVLELEDVDQASGRPGPSIAVNAVVLGPLPTRLRWWHRSVTTVVRVDDQEIHHDGATAVVVANGEYVDGADLVPRGHPGDGRLEVQVYAVRPRERAQLRRRTRSGSHLPHPAIVQRSGRVVEIHTSRSRARTVDGVSRGRRRGLRIRLRPRALEVVTGR